MIRKFFSKLYTILWKNLILIKSHVVSTPVFLLLSLFRFPYNKVLCTFITSVDENVQRFYTVAYKILPVLMENVTYFW